MYVKGSNTRLSNQFKRLIKNDPKAIKLKDLPSNLVIDYQTKQILKFNKNGGLSKAMKTQMKKDPSKLGFSGKRADFT